MARHECTNDPRHVDTYHESLTHRSMRLLKVLNEQNLPRLAYLLLLMTVPWLLICSAALSEGVALPRHDLRVPMLYDIPLYSFTFLAFPLYIYCLCRFDLELNVVLSWLMRERRIKISDDELGNIVQSVQSYYNSRWVRVVCASLAIVTVCGWVLPEFTNGQWTWVSRVTTAGKEVPTVAGCMAITLLCVLEYSMYMCAAMIVGWGYLLQRLSRHPLVIDPVHPDSCGGFGFLNLVQEVIGYLLCGVGIVIASAILSNVGFLDAPLTRCDHVAMVVAFVVCTPLAFFAPIYFLRPQLWQAKREAMAWIDAVLSDALAEPRRRMSAAAEQDVKATAAMFSLVESFGEVRTHIYHMRVLPFDASTFRRFLAWAYGPLVSLALPYLPEGVGRIIQAFG